MATSAKMRCFLRLAKDLALLSHCKRSQTGCVIVPKDCSQVYSIGYNGPASGLPNNGCTSEEGNCGCIHAEANALIKLGDVRNAIMISLLAPCYHCAGLIINSKKITTVYYLTHYRNDRGKDALNSVGIHCEAFR